MCKPDLTMRLMIMTLLLVTSILESRAELQIGSSGLSTSNLDSILTSRPLHSNTSIGRIASSAAAPNAGRDASIYTIDAAETAASGTPTLSGSTVLLPNHTALLKDALLRYQPSNRQLRQSCCPTIDRIVSPTGGTRLDGSYQRLYATDGFRQKFVEHVCAPYSRKKVGQRSVRCVQQSTLVYALFDVDGSVVIDHMQINGGCACILKPKRKKKSHSEHMHT